tara:strand:+ start:842 stop:1108 length:267 start_codon:yes stop_codon:yes gene_type:complete
MTLTSKFRKDLRILQSAVNREIFLDVRNPKLYKKVCRFYKNAVYLDGEDPERDYDLVMECVKQDLESEVVYSQVANPNATNSEFDGYR